MSSPDENKGNVKAFYDLAFNQRQPEEAVKRYVGSSYRQHRPMAGDGPAPFIGFVKWVTGENPDLRVEFKRFIAENDLVAVHSHMIPAKGARGTAVIDIFRLENGKRSSIGTCCRRFRKRLRIRTRCSDLRRQLGGVCRF